MTRHTRRDFLRHTVVGAAICSFVPPWEYLLAAQQGESPTYDLLIRGGHVVDPSQGLSAVCDVAISSGRVTRIATEIAEADVAVFSLEEGNFELVDAHGESRIGQRKLIPVATVKAGKIYGSASIPVAETRGL
jgi:predicted amidohydrolase